VRDAVWTFTRTAERNSETGYLQKPVEIVADWDGSASAKMLYC